MERKLYKVIASSVDARLNCLADEARTGKEHDWTAKHEATVTRLVYDFMPSGSGIDSGVKIDLDKSTGDKLVFHFGYHHMNDSGMYDGRTEHTVTVKPSLAFGFMLSISGPNRNQIKEYLHDLFSTALDDLIDWDKTTSTYFSLSLRAAQESFKAREDKLGN